MSGLAVTMTDSPSSEGPVGGGASVLLVHPADRDRRDERQPGQAGGAAQERRPGRNDGYLCAVHDVSLVNDLQISKSIGAIRPLVRGPPNPRS